MPRWGWAVKGSVFEGERSKLLNLNGNLCLSQSIVLAVAHPLHFCIIVKRCPRYCMGSAGKEEQKNGVMR